MKDAFAFAVMIAGAVALWYATPANAGTCTTTCFGNTCTTTCY